MAEHGSVARAIFEQSEILSALSAKPFKKKNFKSDKGHSLPFIEKFIHLIFKRKPSLFSQSDVKF